MPSKQDEVEEAKLLKLLCEPIEIFKAAFYKDFSLLHHAIHLIFTTYGKTKEIAGRNLVKILEFINGILQTVDTSSEHTLLLRKPIHDFITRATDSKLPEVFTDEDLPAVTQIGKLIWRVLPRTEILKLFQDAPRPLTFSARLLVFQVLLHCLFWESSLKILLEEFELYCNTPNPSVPVVKMMLDVLSLYPLDSAPITAANLTKLFPKRMPKELWERATNALFYSPTEATITYCQRQLQLLSEIINEGPPEECYEYNLYVVSLVQGLRAMRIAEFKEGMMDLAFQLPKIVSSLSLSKESDLVRDHVSALLRHIADNVNGASTLCPHLLELVNSQDERMVDAALHSLAAVIQVKDVTRNLVLRTISLLKSRVTAESACLLIKQISPGIAKENLTYETIVALHKELQERPVSETKFTEKSLEAMLSIINQIPEELLAWRAEYIQMAIEVLNTCASFAENRNAISDYFLPSFLLETSEQSVHSVAPIIAEIIAKLKKFFPQEVFYHIIAAYCDFILEDCILKDLLLNHMLPDMKAGDSSDIIVRATSKALVRLQDEGIPYLTEDLLDSFLSMQNRDPTTYLRGLTAFAKLIDPQHKSSLSARILKLMPMVFEYCWTEAEKDDRISEGIHEALTEYIRYAPQDIALQQAKRATIWLERTETWEDPNAYGNVAHLASLLAIAVPSYMSALFPKIFENYFDDDSPRPAPIAQLQTSYLHGLTIMISMRIFDFFHCSKATYARILEEAKGDTSEGEPPTKKRRISLQEYRNVDLAIHLLVYCPRTKSIQLQSDVSWVLGMFKSRMPAECWDKYSEMDVEEAMLFQPLFQCLPTRLVDISIQTKR